MSTRKIGTFKEFLNEEKELEKLVEAAGNLKGLPKNIVKSIVRGYDGGLGGENSEFKLFKSNAKQSDLTAAIKLVGGFVKPEDRGSRSYSKAELEAKANKGAHAGVLVKINGEWVYYAAFQEYNGKYNLISAKGYEQKEEPRKIGGRIRYDTTYELTATDLSKFIDFKEDKVDIYLVTADVERELKRQERREVQNAINDVNRITPERKKAIIEFLKKRSNGIIDELTADIKESTDKLNAYIASSVNRAITGEEKDISGDFKKITDEINIKLQRINSLGYHIASMTKEGKIKDTHWGGGSEDSYHYKTFKSLVDAYEKEMK